MRGYEQYILRFNIPMDNFIFMEVCDRLEKRLDYASSTSLGVAAGAGSILDYLIKELATRTLLRHNVDEVTVLVAIDHLHDVTVVYLSEQLYLTLQMVEPSNLRLVYRLACLSSLGSAAHALANNTVMTLA